MAIAVDKRVLGGSVSAGLLSALCCGGLPLFASIGLGAFFARLGLWRYAPQILALETASMFALNWLASRRRARLFGSSDRRAMFVSAGIGLGALVVAFFFFEWREEALHITERFLEATSAEDPAIRRQGQLFALASFPAGLIVLGLLPGAPASTPRQRSERSRSMDTAAIKEVVRRRYGAFAESGGRQEACCAAMAQPASGYALDQGLYSPEELNLIPEGALNLSRGCGNPTGFAQLKPGEVVVDLGCGGGIDIILAAQKLGSAGKVIGVDFAAEMIERARQNVAEAGLERDVEFYLADLADTRLPPGSADVVISNCVINLCPNKEAVYREAFHILRPGGRLAISDVVLTEDLPPELEASFRSTWAGCLGGAVPEKTYLGTVGQAGFEEISVVGDHPFAPDELEAMACCPGSDFAPTPPRRDLAAVKGKVMSIKFTAQKPKR